MYFHSKLRNTDRSLSENVVHSFCHRNLKVHGGAGEACRCASHAESPCLEYFVLNHSSSLRLLVTTRRKLCSTTQYRNSATELSVSYDIVQGYIANNASFGLRHVDVDKVERELEKCHRNPASISSFAISHSEASFKGDGKILERTRCGEGAAGGKRTTLPLRLNEISNISFGFRGIP